MAKDEKTILVSEIFERGAYCSKDGAKLKLIENTRLDNTLELFTICPKCQGYTRTPYI